MVKFESRDEMFAPFLGRLNGLHASRPDPETNYEKAHAVIAPGALARTHTDSTNAFHCANGHPHEALLRKRAYALPGVLGG